MKPSDLLSAAEALLDDKTGKPRQAFLRRGTSSVYYALFHTLAQSCADALIGTQAARRDQKAWARVYRSLDHAIIKQRCDHRDFTRFPLPIYNFGVLLVRMQRARHDADYDPLAGPFIKSVLQRDLDEAKLAISAFCATSNQDRRTFAAYLLFKDRRG